jgi:hypothetical protein
MAAERSNVLVFSVTWQFNSKASLADPALYYYHFILARADNLGNTIIFSN